MSGWRCVMAVWVEGNSKGTMRIWKKALAPSLRTRWRSWVGVMRWSVESVSTLNSMIYPLVRIGLRDLSHCMPNTKFALHNERTWRSTKKVTPWTHIKKASHRRWQWSWCPLTTMTLTGGVARVGRPKLCTKCSWTKLWVLPSSTNITTCWSAMWPNRRKVSGARWPERVWRIIWARWEI